MDIALALLPCCYHRRGLSQSRSGCKRAPLIHDPSSSYNSELETTVVHHYIYIMNLRVSSFDRQPQNGSRIEENGRCL